jgi:predicted amidohydrolase YtcJ
VSGPRARVVVRGDVVVEAGHDRVERAEALGIAGGRVVSVGTFREVSDAAARGAAVVGEPGLAVVPGLHDFHLHLVGMARARGIGDLSGCTSFGELLERVRGTLAATPPGEWLRADGWHEEALPGVATEQLAAAIGDRPALLRSHDHHSAWASPAALSLAGIEAEMADPSGGRFERDAGGRLTGIARERAADRLGDAAGRLEGPALAATLRDVARELGALGITGVTDAGDPTTANGSGDWARFGDSFSQLLAHAGSVDGRLRVTVDLPSAALADALVLGLRTGQPVPGRKTMRVGWAKVYADGALGSRTAALFEPYACAGETGRGVLRLEATELAGLVSASARADLALALHAIGDRATAVVLDALEAASSRPRAAAHRLEHLQLVRPDDVRRLAALGVTASVQPVHAAADRSDVEACWPDRITRAYPWRDLQAAGALLAFGSDAPIETPNPWIGMFAAVHRRFADDGMPDWQVRQAVSPVAALAAYTRGPALGAGRADEGHLHPGARADLAVLSIDRATLLAADERLVGTRSVLTLVGGEVVHRA